MVEGWGSGERTDDDAFKGRRKTWLFWSSGSFTYQGMFFFLLRLLPALQNFPLNNSDMPAAAKKEKFTSILISV